MHRGTVRALHGVLSTPPTLTFAGVSHRKPNHHNASSTPFVYRPSVVSNTTSWTDVLNGATPQEFRVMGDADRAVYLRDALQRSSSFQEFHSHVNVSGASRAPLHSDLETLRVLLEGCLKFEQYQFALKWWACGSEAAVADGIHKLLVMRVLGVCGQGKLAVRYFNEWYCGGAGSEGGNKELLDAVTEVVRAHAIAGDVEGTMLWLSQVSALGVTTTAPYSAALLVCTQSRDPDLATKIIYMYYLGSSKQANDLENDGSLIGDYFAALIRLGRLTDALAMFNALQEHDLPGVACPSTYLMLIAACARQHDTREAVKLYAGMISRGIKPTARCVALLMSAHDGKPRRVIEIYHNASKQRGVVPSVSMFHMAMTAARALGDVLLADSIWDDARRAGVRLPAATLSVYIQTVVAEAPERPLQQWVAAPPSLFARAIATMISHEPNIRALDHAGVATVLKLVRRFLGCDVLSPATARTLLDGVMGARWSKLPSAVLSESGFSDVQAVARCALELTPSHSARFVTPVELGVKAGRGQQGIAIVDVETLAQDDIDVLLQLVKTQHVSWCLFSPQVTAKSSAAAVEGLRRRLASASSTVRADYLCPSTIVTAKIYSNSSNSSSENEAQVVIGTVAQYLARHYAKSVAVWTATGSAVAQVCAKVQSHGTTGSGVVVVTNAHLRRAQAVAAALSPQQQQKRTQQQHQQQHVVVSVASLRVVPIRAQLHPYVWKWKQRTHTSGHPQPWSSRAAPRCDGAGTERAECDERMWLGPAQRRSLLQLRRGRCRCDLGARRQERGDVLGLQGRG
eukprot:PhM_4_TR5928/c0_g1_i1/m.11407